MIANDEERRMSLAISAAKLLVVKDKPWTVIYPVSERQVIKLRRGAYVVVYVREYVCYISLKFGLRYVHMHMRTTNRSLLESPCVHVENNGGKKKE